MTELVERARAWVVEVHPHAPHLERTLDWVLVLEPDAGEALQLAAVLHDIERAFPADDEPDGNGYEAWHQRRSADLAQRWLRAQDAKPRLVDDVTTLVRAHEWGGWPEADALQAADSLSFLETQVDLFAGMVNSGRLPREQAEEKLRHMQGRMRIDRARELGAPRLAAALARLDEATLEARS